VILFGLKILLEEWELFKVIMNNRKTFLNVMKALSGNKKCLRSWRSNDHGGVIIIMPVPQR
jgi:hypothetical protein